MPLTKESTFEKSMSWMQWEYQIMPREMPNLIIVFKKLLFLERCKINKYILKKGIEFKHFIQNFFWNGWPPGNMLNFNSSRDDGECERHSEGEENKIKGYTEKPKVTMITAIEDCWMSCVKTLELLKTFLEFQKNIGDGFADIAVLRKIIESKKIRWTKKIIEKLFLLLKVCK